MFLASEIGLSREVGCATYDSSAAPSAFRHIIEARVLEEIAALVRSRGATPVVFETGLSDPSEFDAQVSLYPLANEPGAIFYLRGKHGHVERASFMFEVAKTLGERFRTVVFRQLEERPGRIAPIGRFHGFEPLFGEIAVLDVQGTLTALLRGLESWWPEPLRVFKKALVLDPKIDIRDSRVERLIADLDALDGLGLIDDRDCLAASKVATLRSLHVGLIVSVSSSDRVGRLHLEVWRDEGPIAVGFAEMRAELARLGAT